MKRISNRTTFRRLLRAGAVVTVACALLPFAAIKGPAAPVKPKPPGGFEGSLGVMQPVNLPAKVSRISVIPGTGGGQAWAIGHMKRASEGWAEEQLVFLHYASGSGWRVFGPPKDTGGNVVTNVVLSNLAFAPDGSEGWAVGDRGTVVHWTPDQGWILHSLCDPGGPMEAGCGDLSSVAMGKGGSGTFGYAVGPPRSIAGSGATAPTILRLQGSTWSLDTAVGPVEDYVSVATVSEVGAWAVANSTSKEIRIYERTGAAWERRTTGKPMFDFPAPSNEGDNVNMAALGSAVAASPDGQTIWFGGGLFPVNPVNTLQTADVPFTLRWRGGAFTSYCPPQYDVRNDAVSLEDVCDRRMPVSKFQISSLSIVGNEPSSDVFAGGLGLFHFKGGINGSWFREPDTVSYLGSVSFAAANEGWVASTGAAIGSGSAYTSETTVGHYTANPESPSAAIWPVYTQETLFGVAVHPNGKAFAVGRSGVGLLQTPGIGWDLIGHESSLSYQAVAWNGDTAWGVGDRGVIAKYSGGVWRAIDLGSISGGLGLKGIAFSPSGRGVAVGDRGVILEYSGGSWHRDPASGVVGEDLFDVASAGEEFVIVGAKGRLLSGAPGGWNLDESAKSILEAQAPDMFTVAGLPDGTVVAGGVNALIGREPGGPFRRIAPLDSSGAIMAIDVARSQGVQKILASVTLDRDKFRTRRSALMYHDGDKWLDIGMWSRRTVLTESDSGGYPDPVFAVDLDPSGKRGWAVGGTLPNVRDESDSSKADPSASAYRIDLIGDPTPPEARRSPLLPGPTPGFRFAFFSDSACGRGPCSMTVGSGALADEVALRIREEINAASHLPGGPKFVIFGGNMRFQGIPEEARQFKAFLEGFEIPVYGTLGPQDLFNPDTTGDAFQFVPKPPPQLSQTGLGPPEDAVAAATNAYVLEAFGSWEGPWGSGAIPHGFRAVADPPGTAARIPGRARTFYAFDYAPSGSALARFVFVDTSDFLYAKANTRTQNPPHDQSGWLPIVVAQAVNQSPPLPVIVIANVPTTHPLKTLDKPLMADSNSFETALSSGGVSALFTGYVRANAGYRIQSGVHGVPVFVAGTGGGPPTATDTKRTNDGHYHAWMLVNVDPSTAKNSITSPQAAIKTTVFPVIQSLSMNATRGLEAQAGQTLQFTGLGRALTGGLPPGDPTLSRMTYLNFPGATRCPRGGSTGPSNSCLSQSALQYDWHFVSDDPGIADFVRGSAIPAMPAIVNGALIADDQGGFLCTFRPGKTFVRLISGSTQVRLPVTVGYGFGPCIDKPVLRPPARPLPQPPPDPELLAPVVHIFHPPLEPLPPVVALPPVPGPIPAPAPPASAAGARKEEEEAQTEEQGDEGESAQAWMLSREQRNEPTVIWLNVAAAMAMGLAGAFGAAAVRSRRRLQPNYAEWRRSNRRIRAGDRYPRRETFSGRR